MNQTMHTSSNGTDSSLYPATSLFIIPSVWKGIARIVDLWGSIDEYKYSPSEDTADIEALARDYKIAMKGIADSQRSHERIIGNTKA